MKPMNFIKGKYAAAENMKTMKRAGMSEKDAMVHMATKDKGPEEVLSTKAQKKADKKEHYPYGLEMSLENEAMDKLGIDDMPKAGAKVTVHAHAHVTNTSQHTDQGDKKLRRSMRLQITHMKVGGGHV